MAPEGDAERLVVLGCGFGGYSLLHELPSGLYDTTLVSPRNYFLFTPLLASAVNGTVELRSILEPVRRRLPGLRFVEGAAERIDWEGRTIHGRSAVGGEPFEVPFDLLVVAIGARVSDYGIPGVAEYALTPASVEGARAIRRAIQEQFARAELPGLDEEERRRRLTFVVCGGGPTGVEVAAEIQDLIAEDLRRSYPDSAHLARVVLLEAAERLLTSYDEALAEYTREHFRRENIEVRTRSPVVQIRRGEVRLADGSRLACGRVIWAGGNGPLPLAEALAPPGSPAGRIPIDEHLRLPGHDGAWAIGDC
ncbi:MAG: FAD-dependent oxidoreductase, partial [Thermoanaerobaculia bacterium]|nr:FAD-dependent oxidoreductase [Thermoanaerobaculia bacterium]